MNARTWAFPLLRRGLAVASIVLALGAMDAMAAPEPTLDAREWTAIKRVITAQRQALKKGDWSRAYSYATHGIQLKFGDAENFMRMVQAGYTALIDARYVEFLDGAVIDGNVIQPLRLVMPDNSVLVALYTMDKEDDGRWRIAGCAIAPSTVQAT